MRGRTQWTTAALVAAVGFTTPAAAAGGRSALRFRNAEPSWQPAQKTAQAAPYDLVNDPLTGTSPPAPTAAPTSPFDHTGHLLARDTDLDTCGYVNGEFTSSIYCNSGYECVVNSANVVVGCCPTTSSNCPIHTSCVASSAASLYTSVNSYILFCTDAVDNECITYAYTGADYYGYTAYGCATASAREAVRYSATDSPTSSSEPTSASSSPSTSSKPTTSSSSSSSSSSSLSSSSSITTTSTTTSVSPTNTGGGGGSSSGGSGNHAGAIAGGVVGGVVGLSLVALAAFFLYRRSKQNQANPGTPGAAAVAGGAPGGGGPPQQPQYYSPGPQSPQQPGYGYAAVPAAAGVAAGGVAVAAGAYPQDNKPYGAYDIAQSTSPLSAIHSSPGSPGTVQEPVAPYQSPVPAAGMGFQSGPVPTFEMAELPTERADGELRELA